MLAKTPPMGWNSWNTFGGDISETMIREMADAMVELGYRDAGYEYLVIDDCWSELQRDDSGRLVPDRRKFPNGMKAVSDYIHSRGLKFGMYSCAGVRTCAGHPASFDHEFTDAQSFADWGVDFLKYDFCYKPERADGPLLYYRMGLALKVTGREILYSACNWGHDDAGKWIRSAGAHMYRSTGDIQDNFSSFRDIALSQIPNLCYSNTGCFNDLDMLVVGMYGKGNAALGGCSDAEYRTHFALWCLFNSPLMIGCDLRTLNGESRRLLQNRDLIAINQDPEGRPPFLVCCTNGNRYSFFRHLADGKFAIGYFNLSDDDTDVICSFTDLGLPAASDCGFLLRDVFTGEEWGPVREYYNPLVPAHDCKVYLATLVKTA